MVRLIYHDDDLFLERLGDVLGFAAQALHCPHHQIILLG